jgi:A/G-specific adenine glycosylase
VLREDARVLVVKGSSGARWWRGLWQFPNVAQTSEETEAEAALRAVQEASGLSAVADAPLLTLEHTVTRYRITLTAVPCQLSHPQPTSSHAELAWPRVGELESLAMPAAHRKLARKLFPESS